MQLTLNPDRVFRGLLLVIGILASLHILQLSAYLWIADPEVFGYIEMLDFDIEANLPSLYSALVILLCASVLAVIGKSQRQFGNHRHWWGLAVIFAFLGMDEAIGLHEEIGDAFETLELISAEGYLYFMWVVPYSVILLSIAAVYLRFWWRLPSDTRWGFLISALLFLLGAVVLETISAAEADANSTDTVYYSCLYTVEELLEMVAMAYFLKLLLTYLGRECPEIRVSIDPVQ
jgi:hypothetical protein